MYDFITTAIAYLLVIAVFAAVAGFVYLIVKLVKNNGTYKNWYWINNNSQVCNVMHHHQPHRSHKGLFYDETYDPMYSSNLGNISHSDD